VMSALQHSPICGLEEPGSPIPPMPAKDLKRRGESPAGSRRRHTVAVGAEVRSALTVDGHDRDQK
jgi:hypothetical protein